MLPDQYYDLTWYEFNLIAIKQMRDEEMNLKKDESIWNRWRMSYTLLANVHRDPKKRPNPYRPQDIVRLSFDDEIERDAHTHHPPTPDFIEHLKKRFGSTIKKKDGK